MLRFIRDLRLQGCGKLDIRNRLREELGVVNTDVRVFRDWLRLVDADIRESSEKFVSDGAKHLYVISSRYDLMFRKTMRLIGTGDIYDDDPDSEDEDLDEGGHPLAKKSKRKVGMSHAEIVQLALKINNDHAKLLGFGQKDAKQIVQVNVNNAQDNRQQSVIASPGHLNPIGSNVDGQGKFNGFGNPERTKGIAESLRVLEASGVPVAADAKEAAELGHSFVPAVSKEQAAELVSRSDQR